MATVGSKSLVKKKVLVKSNKSENELMVYCRKCMKTKKESEFFIATDEFLDSNKRFSVCKECCNEIYNIMFESEGNMARAILRCCRMFNVVFDDIAVSATESHIKTIEEKGGKTDNVFGIYKTKLASVSKRGDKGRELSFNLTFTEPNKPLPPSNPIDDKEKNAEELKQFWGDDLNREDYIWLEKKYAKWKAEYSIKTSGEAELLQMIILKLFDIRKARKEKGSTDKLEVAFQNLLKTSGLTPAQTTAASQGKTVDTWGMLIKMVEKEHPAEHYKDYKLFSDFFDLGKYLLNFVTRPITNFFTGQKNYEIDDNDPIFSSESDITFTEGD